MGFLRPPSHCEESESNDRYRDNTTFGTELSAGQPIRATKTLLNQAGSFRSLTTNGTKMHAKPISAYRNNSHFLIKMKKKFTLRI